MQEVVETIREYQEYTDAAKENLKFLREKRNVFSAVKDREWGEATDALSSALDNEFVEDLIGDEATFDNILMATQGVAMFSTDMFMGEVMKREIKKLEKYFKKEEKKLTEMIEEIEEMIEDIDFDIFEEADQKQLDKELNNFMNHILPSSGLKLDSLHSDINSIRGEVFEGELDISALGEVKSSLNSIKSDLEFRGQSSLADELQKMLDYWNNLSDRYSNLNTPDSPSWNEIKDRMSDVDSNLKDTLEGWTVISRGLRHIMIELKQAEDTLLEDWGQSIRDLVTQYETNYRGEMSEADIDSFTGYNEIKQSLDQYIENETQVELSIPNPSLIGDVIVESNFENWRKQANIYKNNNRYWREGIDQVIKLIENIQQHEAVEATERYDNIFSPITEYIIEQYEVVAEPIWEQINFYYNEITFLINKLTEGISLVGDFEEKIQSFREVLSDLWKIIKEIVDSIVNLDFSDIGSQMSAFFSGLLTTCDALGLEKLGEMIDAGEIGEVFGLDKETAQGIEDGVELAGDLANLTRSEIAEELGGDLADLYLKMESFVSSRKRQKDALDDEEEMNNDIEDQEEEIEKKQRDIDKAGRLV